MVDILKGRPGTVVKACIAAAKGCLLAVDGGGIGSAQSGLGATTLRTDVTSPGDWEIFTVVRSSATKFALQTANGHYISAVGGGGAGAPSTAALPLPILTNGKLLQAGTLFHLILLGQDKLRIATSDLKHYVTAVGGGGLHVDGDPIRTDSTQPGEDAQFELIALSADSQTHNGPP